MIAIANPFDRTTKYDSFRKQCSVCNQLKNGCRTAESCSIKRGQCAKLVNFLIVSMFLRVQNHYMPIITLMLKCMRLCVEIKVIETRTKWEGAREITRSQKHPAIWMSRAHQTICDSKCPPKHNTKRTMKHAIHNAAGTIYSKISPRNRPARVCVVGPIVRSLTSTMWWLMMRVL